MPPLKNQKHEAFAKLIAQGESGTQAYLKTYDTTKVDVAKSNASKLLTNNNISARIMELQEKASEKLILSLAKKREMLLDMAMGKTPTKRIITEDGPAEHYEMMKALEMDARLAGELKDNSGDLADPKRLSLMIVQNVFNGSASAFLERGETERQPITIEAATEIVPQGNQNTEEDVDLEA